MSHYECQNCGASLSVGSLDRSVICTFCKDPSIVERPASLDRPTPIFAVGFVLPQAQAQDLAHRKVSRAWLAPQSFRKGTAEKVTGVYIPSYLYSVRCETEYQASIGEDYEETQTYTTTENGRKVTRTRTVTHTEWRSLSGQHSCYVERVVSASSGIPNAELEAIEPFDLRALHRYRPETLAGWAAEDASLAFATCLASAQKEASAEVGSKLSKFLPGDRQRELAYQTEFEDEDLSLALLPIWVLAIRYQPDKRTVRVLVNGQTGRVSMRAPISEAKVAFLAIAGVGLLLLILSQLGAFR